jgi:hypothetical protein
MEEEGALIAEISLLEKVLNDFPTYEELKSHIEILKKRVDKSINITKRKEANIDNKKKQFTNLIYRAESYFLFDEVKVLRYCNSMNNTIKEINYLEEVIWNSKRISGYIKCLQSEYVTIDFFYEVRPPIQKEILTLLEEYSDTREIVQRIESVTEFRLFGSDKELKDSEDKVLQSLGYTRKEYEKCKRSNKKIDQLIFTKIVNSKKILKKELESRIEFAKQNESSKILEESVAEIELNNKLKKFRRGELQNALLPFVKEFKPHLCNRKIERSF